jgi:hypothetical protein
MDIFTSIYQVTLVIISTPTSPVECAGTSQKPSTVVLTHGRGLDMRTLQDELKLRIEDYGTSSELGQA